MSQYPAQDRYLCMFLLAAMVAKVWPERVVDLADQLPFGTTLKYCFDTLGSISSPTDFEKAKCFH